MIWVHFERYGYREDIKRKLNYEKVLLTIITTVMVKVGQNTEISTFSIFQHTFVAIVTNINIVGTISQINAMTTAQGVSSWALPRFKLFHLSFDLVSALLQSSSSPLNSLLKL